MSAQGDGMTDERLAGIEAQLDEARRVLCDRQGPLWASYYHADVAPLLAEVRQLRAEVHVPGRWCCPACNYTLGKSVLAVDQGEIYASKEPGGLCPNDGTPLQMVTWREDAEQGRAFGDHLLDERDRLRAAMERAHQHLEAEGLPQTGREAMAAAVLRSVLDGRVPA